MLKVIVIVRVAAAPVLEPVEAVVAAGILAVSRHSTLASAHEERLWPQDDDLDVYSAAK